MQIVAHPFPLVVNILICSLLEDIPSSIKSPNVDVVVIRLQGTKWYHRLVLCQLQERCKEQHINLRGVATEHRVY